MRQANVKSQVATSTLSDLGITKSLSSRWQLSGTVSAQQRQGGEPARLDAARAEYLSQDQITRLVNGCSSSFRPLVQGALLTGCRYGELKLAEIPHLAAHPGFLYTELTTEPL